MLKKITKILLVIFITLSLLLDIAVNADEPPAPPHRFRGFAIDETGKLASDGTVVSAKLNDVFFNTTVKDGKYGYTTLTGQFYVNGTEDDEGKIIYFYINGIITDCTAVYTIGGFNANDEPNFNLSLDVSPLLINSVTSSSITTTQAVISWSTDKSANSTVNYGTTTSLGYTKHDSNFVQDHTITLTNLQSRTTYYYEVVSYDYSGHMARDNNSGDYYSFTTDEESSPPPGGPGNPSPPPGNTTNNPPIVNANGPYYGLVNQTIFFDASKSDDSDGYIVEYSWDLGDGTTIQTQNVRTSHAYSNVGNYTVKLIVTDDDGATNSTTTIAYISIDDTDGDGWSDEAENNYGTDPNNSTDYPPDNDKDGIPDSVDPDDDNDGLTDDVEDIIGTDPTNDSDVIRILNVYGLFFLIDTDGDNTVDKYYNKTKGSVTDLFKTDEGTFLIDINGDAIYDYIYDPVSGYILPYQKEDGSQESQKQELDTIFYIFIIIIIIVITVIFILYLRGSYRKK